MDDCQWLAELHRTYYDVLLRLARARLRQYAAAADAEDVVQQAFLLAAHKDVRDHEEPLRWLMKTVGNLCMNQAAGRKRALQKQQRLIRQRLDGSAIREAYAVEAHNGAMAECEARMTLKQAMTEDEWQLLKRYCLLGIPVEALAAENGLSPEALRVRIHRLRKKLRKEFYEV